MKRGLICLILLSSILFPAFGRRLRVINYRHTFADGLSCVPLSGWGQISVDHLSEPLEKEGGSSILEIRFGSAGSMVFADTSVMVIGESLEMSYRRPSELEPGKYVAEMRLETVRGQSVMFTVRNIKIEPMTYNILDVGLNCCTVTVEARRSGLKGRSECHFDAIMFPEDKIRAGYSVKVSYSEKGRENGYPVEGLWDNRHRVYPGVYDITCDISLTHGGGNYKLLFEDFEPKADMYYYFVICLDGGYLRCTGGKGSERLHFYPAGMSDSYPPAEKPEFELFTLERGASGEAMDLPPGSYDVLVEYRDGASYRWFGRTDVGIGDTAEIRI